MKRLDLVQLTIIIVGLFSAFFCLELLPQFLFYLITWISGNLMGFMMQYFIMNILLVSTYLIFTIYSLKNSKQFAESICSNANFSADVNFAINKTELLYVLFIGFGIYGLVKTLPSLCVDFYMYAGNNVTLSELSVKKITGSTIITEIITTGLYFILLYYASIFAEFLSVKINNTEPEDEIEHKQE